MFDPLAIDNVFRSLNREIWVLTATAAADRGGLVATWVSQASLDPAQPVVVVGVAINHHTRNLIDYSGQFGLHLLRPEQIEVAINFAVGSGADRDKLAGLPLLPTEGPPLLVDCHSRLECRVQARFDGGDRIYYWADVVHGEVVAAESTPMRESELIGSAAAQQLAELRASRESDIEVQRPLIKAWREALPSYLRMPSNG